MINQRREYFDTLDKLQAVQRDIQCVIHVQRHQQLDAGQQQRHGKAKTRLAQRHHETDAQQRDQLQQGKDRIPGMGHLKQSGYVHYRITTKVTSNMSNR